MSNRDVVYGLAIMKPKSVAKIVDGKTPFTSIDGKIISDEYLAKIKESEAFRHYYSLEPFPISTNAVEADKFSSSTISAEDLKFTHERLKAIEDVRFQRKMEEMVTKRLRDMATKVAPSWDDVTFTDASAVRPAQEPVDTAPDPNLDKPNYGRF